MKNKKCSLSKISLIASLILMTTMAMTMPSEGWAMLAPPQVTTDAQQINSNRAEDLKTIQAALESKIVRQRLSEYKLTQEQIDTRLSKLSDAQVHQTAMQIRTVTPGGDGGDFLITVLVIAILVALFMYIFKRV
jgi:hypothetical protein